jgi:hypothetical protein
VSASSEDPRRGSGCVVSESLAVDRRAGGGTVVDESFWALVVGAVVEGADVADDDVELSPFEVFAADCVSAGAAAAFAPESSTGALESGAAASDFGGVYFADSAA